MLKIDKTTLKKVKDLLFNFNFQDELALSDGKINYITYGCASGCMTGCDGGCYGSCKDHCGDGSTGVFTPWP